MQLRYPATKLWDTLSVGCSLRDPTPPYPYSKILILRSLWFGRAEGGAGKVMMGRGVGELDRCARVWIQQKSVNAAALEQVMPEPACIIISVVQPTVEPSPVLGILIDEKGRISAGPRVGCTS